MRQLSEQKQKARDAKKAELKKWAMQTRVVMFDKKIAISTIARHTKRRTSEISHALLNAQKEGTGASKAVRSMIDKAVKELSA